MKIKILMITFNRPEYTKLSLSRLCDSVPKNAKIVIWDNSSNQETINVIKKFEGHPRIERIIYNKTNDKLRGPTNWFWMNSKDADLIGKVDDDCLVPDNWCEILQQAHIDIPDAGVLGCWRFLPEDFNEEMAMKKIQSFRGHKIMRNCWIEGSGYLMKRVIIKKIGYLRPKESFTTYCIRAAAKGFINGWYYPFLYQEHMDDPRAEHTGIRTETDFQRLKPLSAINFKIETREAWDERLRKSAQRLQAYSFDHRDHIGFRAKIKKKIYAVVGKEYVPLVD